ncbi:ABC transporter permease [Lichenicoccus roseus]|uniref:ABC transporter permease n=1 Tax=Lichenicoccus roseus TaxID=2683649 RepID=A0A5R9J143_9PROT|nr:ABC transporter permease [Lichenicoccus roseus]TLU71354.1 ABC transporter permease [Lichenicoccus roseus]
MPADTSAGARAWLPLLLVALVCSAGFAVLSDRFLTSFNIYVVLSSATLLALIGYSQLATLAVGDFSLAVGGIGEFTGIVLGYLLHTAGWPLLPAIVAAIAVALASGVLNGLIVVASGVSGFIVTLATGGAFAGAALAITETTPYTGLPAAFNFLGTGRVGPVPLAIVTSLLAAALLGVLYNSRRIGRLMLAVGDNPEAASLSGLSRREAVLWAHSLSGLLAGIAGVVATAQLHEANPTAGTGWLIQSFTVPIIGGTLLTGGVVSVFGILVASLILATINDGLILLDVGPYWVTLVEGLLVFFAVLLGRTRLRDLLAHVTARAATGRLPESGAVQR